MADDIDCLGGVTKAEIKKKRKKKKKLGLKKRRARKPRA